VLCVLLRAVLSCPGEADAKVRQRAGPVLACELPGKEAPGVLVLPGAVLEHRKLQWWQCAALMLYRLLVGGARWRAGAPWCCAGLLGREAPRQLSRRHEGAGVIVLLSMRT
jgi:hypothetical protein